MWSNSFTYYELSSFLFIIFLRYRIAALTQTKPKVIPFEILHMDKINMEMVFGMDCFPIDPVSLYSYFQFVLGMLLRETLVHLCCCFRLLFSLLICACFLYSIVKGQLLYLLSLSMPPIWYSGVLNTCILNCSIHHRWMWSGAWRKERSDSINFQLKNEGNLMKRH